MEICDGVAEDPTDVSPKKHAQVISEYVFITEDVAEQVSTLKHFTLSMISKSLPSIPSIPSISLLGGGPI
jgi:hypothetical protein